MANENVIIGCKLPHGIHLDLYDKHNNLVARHSLAGNASFSLPNPDRKFQNAPLIHGDAFTSIPKEHWDAWLKIHSDHPSVLSGGIYAAAKKEDAQAQARNHEGDNIGFNKVDPKTLGVEKLDDKPKPVGA